MTKQELIDSLDDFTYAYIECLLFTTTEDDFPEYCYIGEFSIGESVIEKFDIKSLKQIIRECKEFQKNNRELLDQAGDDEQNGCDFAYTRNGHGVGFWDRGYPDEVADPLSEAARQCGERYLWKLNKRIISYERV